MTGPAAEVGQALALLKSLSFIMGRRDAAFDKITLQAVALLERAKAGLRADQEPLTGLEPSVAEWLYRAAETALRTAEAREEALTSALQSIREWAVRQLPSAEEGTDLAGLAPLQLR